MPQTLRLCIMATIGKSIQVLYRGRLEYFRTSGFDITVVCAPSELDEAIRSRGVRLFTAPLTRAITPLTDLRALWRLTRFFRREQFDIVEVSTPKAALLGAIAARLAGTRTVVHLLQGLAYEGKTGLQGWLLRKSTRIPCRLARLTIAVSISVRDEVIRASFCGPDRIRVLGGGTVNGVDALRFLPPGSASGLAVRDKFGIASGSIVIGFVGRMVRDKGIEELVAVFDRLQQNRPGLTLLVLGDYEVRDKPSRATMDFIATNAGVRHVGWQQDIVPFLSAMDIFVLPTYREGFGTALIEAACACLPIVSTNVTGARDAVIENVTGLLVPPRNSDALQAAIEELLDDSALRKRLGQAGRKWVEESFKPEDVWALQINCYRQLHATATQDS